MYKVTFEPNYDTPLFLGEVNSQEEALQLISLYCNTHKYTPPYLRWNDFDESGRAMVDVGSYHDFFYIEEKR